MAMKGFWKKKKISTWNCERDMDKQNLACKMPQVDSQKDVFVTRNKIQKYTFIHILKNMSVVQYDAFSSINNMNRCTIFKRQ